VVAWLLREGEVLASLEVLDSVPSRMKGLIGRDRVDCAVLLPRTRAIHTVGMRFPIDVAFCTSDMKVVATITNVRPLRLSMPRLKASCVIEAEAGSFGRWGLRAGDQLEVKG